MEAGWTINKKEGGIERVTLFENRDDRRTNERVSGRGWLAVGEGRGKRRSYVGRKREVK